MGASGELYGELPEELAILVREIGEAPPEPSPEPAPEPVSDPIPEPAPAPAPILTPVPPLSKKKDRGRYILEEEDLPEEDVRLLHGRAMVIDGEAVTETSSGNPRTYYIAYDQVQGLVVPARSLSIEAVGPDDLYYRWTDDGEQWTAWTTLYEGMTHEYEVDNKCRFAEVQVYAETSGAILNIRATR